MEGQKEIFVIAGPNGAGKSTLAPFLLRDKLQITNYVNADTIALGLSAFAPDTTAFEAGRITLRRLDELAVKSTSFGFETTLASRTYQTRFKNWQHQGYEIYVLYIWLRNEELAIERVQARVRIGGHQVAEEVVRRRYQRGATNFKHLYQSMADQWAVLDNSETGYPLLVAKGGQRESEIVYHPNIWEQFWRESHE